MVLVNEKTGFKKAIVLFLFVVGLFVTQQIRANAQVLYSGVPVSDVGFTGNSISQANTSRCLAVAPDGTIYALYHGTNGIRITKSTNRGASFSPSVLIRNGNFESEVAVSSNGNVFVAWVESGNAFISESTNGGSSFSGPVLVGTASTTVHMAVDGDYVYLIDRPGSSFYYSSNGGQTFTKKTFNETYVFSDVHVDPLTGNVIIQKDNPQIVYYISKDHGQTFGSKNTPSASVNYSVGGISSGPLGTYLFVAGYSTMATRINLADNTAKTLSFGSSLTSQGRSLSVDGFGNVVTGFISNGNVYYAASQDLGNTFGATRMVAAATMANAAANTTNGDVMFLYESAGKIYLSVFNDELKGYSLKVSTTNLNFAGQAVGTESGEKAVTVSNNSASDIVVKNIGISGNDFVVSHNIGNVLKAGQSYNINVKFVPTQSGSLLGLISILTDISTEPRTIQLTGTGIDNTPPVTKAQITGNLGLNNIYTGDISLTFTATDGTSGDSSILNTEYSIDNGQSWIQATGPVVFTNDGEYEVQFRSTDKSGNVESPNTLSFKIDRTSPAASVEYSTTASVNTSVTAKIIPSENVTVTNNNGSDTYIFEENGNFTFEFIDEAGNTGSAVAKVSNIDKIAPSGLISYDATEFTNQNVIATLTADEPIIITNNDGSNIYTFTDNGTFKFQFKDPAGNIAEAVASVSNIDKSAPEIHYEILPEPGINGWNNDNVTIHITASDDLSGIQFITPDISMTSEGENQSTIAKAVDNAGNESSLTITGINIDKTPPDLSYELSPAPNENGWNKDNVKVHFIAEDGLSGIDSVTPDVILSLTGANQEVSGIAVDKAGNKNQVKLTVNLDKTEPSVSGNLTSVPNDNGWFNSDVTVHFAAEDDLSGIDSVSPDITISSEGDSLSAEGNASDKAGNTSSTKVTGIKIDKTAPELTYEISPFPNAEGWNNGDVLVHFTASDGLSGVENVTPDIVLTTDAQNQTVEGIATDKAGNKTTITVTGINIDKTAPVVEGKATTEPNNNGWYKGDVSVHFTASDALSGVESLSPDVTISTEGSDLSASGTAADIAGNIGTGYVKGINIDKTVPGISYEIKPVANSQGWNSTDVVIHFIATDSLSGIDSVTSDVTLSFDGTDQTVTGTAVDKAGNISSITVSGINIDKVKPSITSVATGFPNSNGWYNSDVTVKYTASDNLSGIDSVTPDTVISSEGINQSVIGTAVDKAGNSENVEIKGINIDKTKPLITGETTAKPNSNGWFNRDVIVSFTANDSLAGIDTVTPDQILSEEGANQSIQGTAVDKAGNTGNYTVTGINIDKTSPSITINAPLAVQYKTSDSLKLDFSSADTISGINSITATLDGKAVTTGQAIVLSAFTGSHTLTVTTTDNAGNSSTKTVTFTVAAAIDGKIKILSASGKIKSNTDTLFPRFKVVNNGKDPIKLSDIKLRYYYTTDINMPQNFICDWATFPVGSANVTGSFVKMDQSKVNADYYLEVGFKGTAGSLAPGSEIELHCRIVKTDWSIMNQLNDFSFSNDTRYTINPKTPGYVAGQLQFGQEPDGNSVAKVEKVKIQAYNKKRNSNSDTISTLINLVNTGNTDIKLSELKIRYYYTKDNVNNQNFFVDYSSIGESFISGSFVNITPSENTADSYLEISFSADAGTLYYGSTLPLNFRILSGDGKAKYIQANDYSFNGTSTNFVDSTAITVIKGGEVIWGIAP